MSKEIHATSLSIVRSAHLARDAVLFTLWGAAVYAYYPDLFSAYPLLLWFILDLFGFFFLWVPREDWQKVGVGWGGLMSIILLIFVIPYSGAGYFGGGSLMILLLCITELLVVLKITYDVIKAEAKSWTEGA